MFQLISQIGWFSLLQMIITLIYVWRHDRQRDLLRRYRQATFGQLIMRQLPPPS